MNQSAYTFTNDNSPYSIESSKDHEQGGYKAKKDSKIKSKKITNKELKTKGLKF